MSQITIVLDPVFVPRMTHLQATNFAATEFPFFDFLFDAFFTLEPKGLTTII
jgi:hypothetical protein